MQPNQNTVSTRTESRLQAAPLPTPRHIRGLFSLLILILILLLIRPAPAQTSPPTAFGNNVISYSSGSGIPGGYTNSSAALGEPSRITPGQFGGPVDVFNPPYLSEQLVSVGAGGHLTLQFDSLVPNNPANPFGMDFIIFGNAGFAITNGDFSGGGITDGSLFGANSGETRVSVSADGAAYYELSTSLAPVVDSPFPTDGRGNFHTPVNPALTPDSFSGKNLAQIRELYAGSGGGTPFDISWARTSQGQPANLGAIQFVRIDVLSGVSEIDGLAMVVPEPTACTLLVCGLLALLRKYGRARLSERAVASAATITCRN